MDLVLITNKLETLWAKVPQERITKALILALLAYIAFWFADFTWNLMPSSVDKIVTVQQQNANQSANTLQVDTSALKKLNLFGEYNKQPVVVQQTVKTIASAPETKLQLTLTGLVASDEPEIAAAIIESKGKQETYGIDDKIEGTRAILKQVYIDRVIIESSGRLETLMLDGFDYTKDVLAEQQRPVEANNSRLKMKTDQGLNLRTSPKVDLAKQARIKERVSKARAEILENPGKLTDYIKISPYRKDGKVVGYRLMPNKDPEFFTEVGLVAGDVAVQINGKDLTDMRQAQQALIELRKAEHVDLLVNRDGELHDISLGLK